MGQRDDAKALHEARYPRIPAKFDDNDEPPPVDLEEIQIWDLLEVFSRLMKEVVNLTESMNLEDGYHVETYATAIIKSHPDSMEAARAFKEKRPPVFGQDQGGD